MMHPRHGYSRVAAAGDEQRSRLSHSRTIFAKGGIRAQHTPPFDPSLDLNTGHCLTVTTHVTNMSPSTYIRCQLIALLLSSVLLCLALLDYFHSQSLVNTQPHLFRDGPHGPPEMHKRFLLV